MSSPAGSASASAAGVDRAAARSSSRPRRCRCGGENQRAGASLIERVAPAEESARHVRGDEHRRALRREREVVGVRGQLEQRERISARRAVQPLAASSGKAAQQRRRGARQAADPQRREVGALEQRRLVFANGDQDGDRVG